MPFGGESVEDRTTRSPLTTARRLSPMPFGGESVEDLVNCDDANREVFRSPMPFGGESVEDIGRDHAELLKSEVTNAFRRGVR